MAQGSLLPTITALSVLLFLLLLHAGQLRGQAQQQSSQGPTKKPQIYIDVGPFKLSASFKESKLKDRLKLYKMAISYYLGSETDFFHKHIGKVVHREDLVRCENFLAKTSEMESLIDCKPLEQQVFDDPLSDTSNSIDQASPSVTYAKRSSTIAKGKLDFLPFLTEATQFRQEYQLYPFKADFVDQNIKRILKAHDMDQQTLGFGQQAVTTGYFVMANLSNLHPHTNPIQCTANLFISINQSEPAPPLEAGDDYPEIYHAWEHKLNQAEKNGGLLSLQDVSCTKGSPVFALETDFTIIHRKQFPYMTVSHTISSKPLTSLWNYNGTIRQTRGEAASAESYNTSVVVASKSNLIGFLNFYLNQNFTNQDFSTGFELMYFVHPLVTSVIKSDWTKNSLVKSMAVYPIDMISKGKDPNYMFMYTDKPEQSFVSMTVTVNRQIFYDYLASFSSSFGAYTLDNSTEKPTDVDSVPLPPELMSAIEDIVNQFIRDEL